MGKVLRFFGAFALLILYYIWLIASCVGVRVCVFSCLGGREYDTQSLYNNRVVCIVWVDLCIQLKHNTHNNINKYKYSGSDLNNKCKKDNRIIVKHNYFELLNC